MPNNRCVDGLARHSDLVTSVALVCLLDVPFDRRICLAVHYVLQSRSGAVLRSTLDAVGNTSLGGTDDPVIVSLGRWWDGFHGSFQRTGPTADDLEPLSLLPSGMHAALATLGRHEMGSFLIGTELLDGNEELLAAEPPLVAHVMK